MSEKGTMNYTAPVVEVHVVEIEGVICESKGERNGYPGWEI